MPRSTKSRKGATKKAARAPGAAAQRAKRKPATRPAATSVTRSAAKKPAATSATRQAVKQPAATGTAQALLAYSLLPARDFTDSVRLVAEGMFSGRAAITDGEAFGFDTPDGGVFVEAQLEPRIVRVAAHLGASRGAPVLIARLVSDTTARLMMGRVIEADRALFYVVDVPAEPFVPLHAAQAIVMARAAAPEIRAELAEILED